MYTADCKTAYLILLTFTAVHMAYTAYKRNQTKKYPEWQKYVFALTSMSAVAIAWGVYTNESEATWYQASFWTFYGIMTWAAVKLLRTSLVFLNRSK
jgi:hypothetical protein